MVFKEKRTLIFSLVVLAVFLVANYRYDPRTEPAREAYSLPLTIGKWRATDVNYDRDKLISWLGAKDIVFRRFTNPPGSTVVTLYLGIYQDFESSDKAHAPEVCYPGQGWKILSKDNVNLSFQNGIFKVKRMVIAKQYDQEVVYSWWQTKDKAICSNAHYHFHQILNRILGKDNSSVWVRISSESNKEGDSGQGEEDIIQFCSSIIPLLSNYFQTEKAK